MRYLALIAVLACGCGGGSDTSPMTAHDFCGAVVLAYCEDQANCLEVPDTCRGEDAIYQKCADAYGCRVDGVDVDSECFAEIVGDAELCDAPAEYPASCPEVCP